VQEKITRFGEFPAFARFLFEDVELDGAAADGVVVREALVALRDVEPFTAAAIEQALRGLAERLELSPRKAFQPIRVAVTGSTISPGLFESLELLGKETALARLSAAAAS
jgi:glutamyl-tRNA synthetase